MRPIDAAGAMYPDLPRATTTTSGVSGNAKPSWAKSNNNPMWQPAPEPKRGMTTQDYQITSYWLNRKRSK